MNKASLWLTGIAVVVVAGGGYYYSTMQKMPVEMKPVASVATPPLAAPMATPTGITLQYMGRNAQGYNEQDHIIIVLQPTIAYADAKGLTLYTYDKDQPGKPSCTAECAANLVPAAVPANAKPVGAWSIVARDDGSKQWALNNMPLYTYVKDKLPGESGGNDAGHKDEPGTNYKPGSMKKYGAAAVVNAPDAHVALFDPVKSLKLPHGVSATAIGDADGVALVDGRGMTLYAFDGDINADQPACVAGQTCTSSQWSPAAAPALANPVGDFTVVARNDGIKQWVYKGKPLYTFEGDLQATFANGVGVDKRWNVALIERFYQPANVKIGQTPGRGAVLTTADGKTLYKRDGFAFQSGGGHSFRHGVPNRPAVGRAIGTKNCDAECLKTWHPYAAPADAVPTGYWEVMTREDGSKQWAYQGYALYSYDGDKKPGDMTGNDIYDIAMSDDPNKTVDVGAQMTGTAALYWGVIAP